MGKRGRVLLPLPDPTSFSGVSLRHVFNQLLTGSDMAGESARFSGPGLYPLPRGPPCEARGFILQSLVYWEDG